MKSLGFFSACFFTFVWLFVLPGCSNSYTKANSLTRVSAYPAAIEQAKKDHRYFMMRSGINLYTITSVDLDHTKKQMTVTLDKVDSSRLPDTKSSLIKQPKPQKGEASVSFQIHLLMADSTSYTLDEPHTIPLNKVRRVELLN